VRPRGSIAAVFAFAAAAACGGGSPGGSPASGTSTVCPAGTYILGADCVDLPPFSDAAVTSDDGASVEPDGAPLVDAGNNSPIDADEADDADDAYDGYEITGDEANDALEPPSDPLAPCLIASDVLVVHAVYPTRGEVQTVTYTNFDARFVASNPPPLAVSVSGNDQSSASVSLALFDDAGVVENDVVPTIGTYPTGTGGIFLDVEPFGETDTFNGNVTIEDVELDTTDGGPAVLRSLLFSYDMSNGNETISGCMRYTAAPPVGGSAGAEGGAADGSSAAIDTDD